VSFIAGGYPDERQMMDLSQKGEWEQAKALLTWQVYLYLASMLILGIIGCVIQYKYFSGDEDEKKDEKTEPLHKKEA
jgi:hypothetical protein